MRTRSMQQPTESTQTTVLSDVTKIVAQKGNVVVVEDNKTTKQAMKKTVQEQPAVEAKNTRGAKKAETEAAVVEIENAAAKKTSKKNSAPVPEPEEVVMDENTNPAIRTHIRFGDKEKDNKVERIAVELKKPEDYPLYPYREPVQEDDVDNDDNDAVDEVDGDDQDNTDEFIVAPLPSVPAWQGTHIHFSESDDADKIAENDNAAGDLVSHLLAMTMDCGVDAAAEVAVAAPTKSKKTTKKAAAPAEPIVEPVAEPAAVENSRPRRTAKKQ